MRDCALPLSGRCDPGSDDILRYLPGNPPVDCSRGWVAGRRVYPQRWDTVSLGGDGLRLTPDRALPLQHQPSIAADTGDCGKSRSVAVSRSGATDDQVPGVRMHPPPGGYTDCRRDAGLCWNMALTRSCNPFPGVAIRGAVWSYVRTVAVPRISWALPLAQSAGPAMRLANEFMTEGKRCCQDRQNRQERLP